MSGFWLRDLFGVFFCKLFNRIVLCIDLMYVDSRIICVGILALVEAIGSFLLFLLMLDECAHVEKSRFTTGIALIWCNVEESLSV